MKENEFKRNPPTDNTHDKVFFRIARRSKRYVDLVKLALGEKRTHFFDWDSAELMDSRLVDIEFKEMRADLLLSVKLMAGGDARF